MAWQPAGPTGDGNAGNASIMFDELEWPSLEACSDRSSLLLFHNIHCGAVHVLVLKNNKPCCL